MGDQIFDQYSLLHLATGIIAYFWGLSFMAWIYIHLLFELLENTDKGMHIINTYIKLWPGGKSKSDTFINSFSDTIFSVLGWIIAYYIDHYKSKYKHIKN